MGEANRRRASDPNYGSSKPHFIALETRLVHGGGHDGFSTGDRLWAMLDGCVLCGRLAHVAICPDGASCNDNAGGWTLLHARLVDTPLGASLNYDGARNHLCADCVAKHGNTGRRFSDAPHKRLDRLDEKIWTELKLRYDCPLCEMRWLPAGEEAIT